jgi:hypothetical protein
LFQVNIIRTQIIYYGLYSFGAARYSNILCRIGIYEFEILLEE